MIDPGDVPPVEQTELLSRYVMQSGHFRSDHTIKPNLFIPHPHQELSVTRHRDATEKELWSVGTNVADQQQRTLYGKAVILTSDCIVASLQVVAKPLHNNPNHADIEGWPSQKEDQKLIALKLAASASKLIPPPSKFIESEKS